MAKTRYSPFKKYGRRKIVKLNVDEQKKTYQSNAKDGLRVGQAVGSIGTQIGDAISEQEKEKKNAEVDQQTEDIINQTDEPYGTEESLAAEIIGEPVDEELVDPEWTDIEEDIEHDWASPTNIGNNGSGSTQGGGAAPANGNPYPDRMITGANGAGSLGSLGEGGAENFANNLQTGFNNLVGGGSGHSEGNTGKPVNQGGAGFWSNLGAAVQSGNQKQFLKKAHGSAFKRHSPFHATQYDPNTGTPIGEGYLTRAKAPSYLGEIGAAGAEGYNSEIDRYNYKRQVWEVKQNELDQQFGDLEVPPSGNAPYDASVETMAKQWQQELVDLQNNKGNMDPGEFTARKHDILGRSKTYKAASESINQLLTDYANDKDQISTSTKPEILDLIETLTQGGNIQIMNDPESGQPTMIGETLNGKPVRVPLAEIANGKNAFRYNKKVDVTAPLAAITKGLGQLKQNIETSAGVKISGPQAWEAVKQSASAQLDNMLANEATVRSVAADRFNIDYDAYEAKGSDVAKQEVKDLLMQEIQKQYAPYEGAITRSQPGGQSGVVNQRNAANAAAVQQQLNAITDFTNADNLQTLVGGKIEQIATDDVGTYVIAGGKEYDLPKDPAKARYVLQRIMGVQAQYLK